MIRATGDLKKVEGTEFLYIVVKAPVQKSQQAADR